MVKDNFIKKKKDMKNNKILLFFRYNPEQASGDQGEIVRSWNLLQDEVSYHF